MSRSMVEAARWRLLGLLFERPRRGWCEEIEALAREVGDARLIEAARQAAAVTEGAYLAVMGPGGTVSPREVAYRPMGDPGRILAGLRGIYEAFGYAPLVEDPPDHVAVQIGFVGFMKLKQAYAEVRDEAGAARLTAEAVAGFIDDHLAGFSGELARRLASGAPEHLVQTASILAELCPGAPLPLVDAPSRESADCSCDG